MTRPKAQSTTNPSQSSLTPPNRILPRSGNLPSRQYHRWTDEELNLLAYYRTRQWSYARIQRKHFPSFTKTSLLGTYNRLTLKERTYRASIVAGSITTSRIASRNKDSAHSRPIPGTSHRSHPVPQPEGNCQDANDRAVLIG